MHHQQIDTVTQWITVARGACVAFTGAGLGVASGIPAFRGAGGVWDKYPPDQFATRFGIAKTFAWRFDGFRTFILDTARTFLNAQPNETHRVLATLENAGLLGAVITQNVDGFHEQAGNAKVLPLHGSFYRGRCGRCGATNDFTREEIATFIRHLDLEGVSRRSFLRAYRRHGPRCRDCGQRTRPDMVLFGERVAAQIYEQAAQEAERCRLMLVMGTSLMVRPASDIPYIALHAGAKVVEINSQPTELTPLAHLRLDIPGFLTAV